MDANLLPPAVNVESTQGDQPPVRRISSEELRNLGMELQRRFETYRQARQLVELRWLKSLRQYLGIYDSEIERQLPASQSRAYPKLTRVKVLSVLSRLMNLMFPGNEKNWEISASPSPDMDPQDVMEMLATMFQEDQQAGAPPKPPSRATVRRAVQRLADERAREMSLEIEDQLQEIGGDQSLDYIGLVRAVVRSGIIFGAGVLQGPYAEPTAVTVWDIGEDGQPVVETKETYRPSFEFLSVWDFYPDMTARSLTEQAGYFTRKVLTRPQMRELMDQPDRYFGDQIRKVLRQFQQGNFKPQSFETELRTMGDRSEINDLHSTDSTPRYEVRIWHGPISGKTLQEIGVDIADAKTADDIDAEIWIVDSAVIRADINPWRRLGKKVRTIHPFIFDEDDTSPVGNGLPNVMRDSQMSVCAATRMLLDNASIVAGPNIEINLDLLEPTEDTQAIAPYRIWRRLGNGVEAQFPAVRNIEINAHMNELLQIVELFMRFADQETFVGPAAGGEVQGRAMAEPMRTAAGASMLRADASLPFKDIVRNFDTFTQSLLLALVQFNEAFNPKIRPGDYNVIARGATSLIAKEVRGQQVDLLATTLTPEEKMHVDDRKFVEARFAVRDLDGLLVSPDEAERRAAANQEKTQRAEEIQQRMSEAQIRKVLADALKNVAQSQKNETTAQATAVKAMLDVMEKGLTDGGIAPGDQGAAGGAAADAGGAARRAAGS